MAAFAQFPWVRACLDAIGTDLSGLPLRIVRGIGDQAEVIEEPALRAQVQAELDGDGIPRAARGVAQRPHPHALQLRVFPHRARAF